MIHFPYMPTYTVNTKLLKWTASSVCWKLSNLLYSRERECGSNASFLNILQSIWLVDPKQNEREKHQYCYNSSTISLIPFLTNEMMIFLNYHKEFAFRYMNSILCDI